MIAKTRKRWILDREDILKYLRHVGFNVSSHDDVHIEFLFGQGDTIPIADTPKAENVIQVTYYPPDTEID